MTKQNRHWQVTDYEVREPYVIPQYGDYTVGQVERCPDTEKLHWQLYCYTKERLSIKAFKKRYPTVHFEVANNPDALRKYGQKEESRVAGPFEWGEAPAQGKRTDLHEAIATWQRHGKRKACEDHPDVIAKYHKGIQFVVDATEPLYVPPVLELREHQRTLLDSFLSDNNPRHVYYLYDQCGGSGKSTFADYLYRVHGAAVFTEGKYADLAFAYQCESIVVFDLARAQEKELSKDVFRFIEGLSDGRITSTKYESKVKTFKPAKCIVMSNTSCDITLLSSDRWIHVDWSNHGQGSQVPPAFEA